MASTTSAHCAFSDGPGFGQYCGLANGQKRPAKGGRRKTPDHRITGAGEVGVSPHFEQRQDINHSNAQYTGDGCATPCMQLRL